MVSIRSILATITFFTAFVFAAPASEASADIAKRDLIGDITQYFQTLSGDIEAVAGDFGKLVGQAADDVAHDATHIIGEVESIFASNTTFQSLLNELNPADISGAEIQQIASAIVKVIQDLLSFIPTAATVIFQAKDSVQQDIQKLLTVPHNLIQLVLTILAQLSSKVPAIGGAIEFFLNLLKTADNTLYNIL